MEPTGILEGQRLVQVRTMMQLALQKRSKLTFTCQIPLESATALLGVDIGSSAAADDTSHLITSDLRRARIISILRNYLEDLRDMGVPFDDASFLAIVIDSVKSVPHENKPPCEGNIREVHT